MALSPPLYTYESDWTPDMLRKVWDPYQEGVLDDGLEVTAGAEPLSVDVAPGAAFVQGDDQVDQGLYRVFNDASENSAGWGAPIAEADDDDPRLDQIVLRVYDDEMDDSGEFVARLEVVTGTPTTGATLSNRDGAAPLPNTALPLADVLVPAEASMIEEGDIADVRPDALAGFSSGGGGGGGGGAEEVFFEQGGIGGSLDGMELTADQGDIVDTTVELAEGEVLMAEVALVASNGVNPDSLLVGICDAPDGVLYEGVFKIPYAVETAGGADLKTLNPVWRVEGPGSKRIVLRVLGDTATNDNILIYHYGLQLVRLSSSA